MTEQTEPGALDNAERIIERFGGIRPMATKMDVPVTTVQGWKNRNVIPENRRDAVLQAARSNNIDIEDLIGKGAANENEGGPSASALFAADIRDATGGIEDAAATVTAAADGYGSGHDEDLPGETVIKAPAFKDPAPGATEDPDDIRPARVWDEGVASRARSPGGSAGNESCAPAPLGVMPMEELDRKIAAARGQAFRGAVVVSALMFAVLACGGAGLAAVAMKTTEAARVLSLPAPASGGLEAGDVEALRAELAQIESRLGALESHPSGDAVTGAAPAAPAADTSALEERLNAVESKMASAGPDQMLLLLDRLRDMQSSAEGRQALAGLARALGTVIAAHQGDVDAALNDARQGQTALGAFLMTVGPADMKAAALLTGYAQLRASVAGSAPFDEDLQLMAQLTGAAADPAVMQKIEKLSPIARQGIPGRKALTDRFSTVSHDIVVASLAGADVSLRDKAVAKLAELVQLRRDGQLLTGTDTQARVARAQDFLDKGDIAGAAAELQALDGPAAEAARPFLESAQAFLMTAEAQDLIAVRVKTLLAQGNTAAIAARTDELSAREDSPEHEAAPAAP